VLGPWLLNQGILDDKVQALCGFFVENPDKKVKSIVQNLDRHLGEAGYAQILPLINCSDILVIHRLSTGCSQGYSM
jgi:hypothetical protein